jgi:hypothetical protein
VLGVGIAVFLVALGVGQIFSRPEDSRHFAILHKTSVFVIAPFIFLLGAGILFCGISCLFDNGGWFSGAFRRFALPLMLMGLVCMAGAAVYFVLEIKSK